MLPYFHDKTQVEIISLGQRFLNSDEEIDRVDAWGDSEVFGDTFEGAARSRPSTIGQQHRRCPRAVYQMQSRRLDQPYEQH